MGGQWLSNIKITFVSLDSNIEKIVREVFHEGDNKENNNRYQNIVAEHSNITRCSPHDCIVSPANSFGLMDGGIDADLTYMLSKLWDKDYIGRKVRKIIEENYYGEQPVGTCMLVSTENDNFPWLAHAPTMRNPHPVKGTLNPYYAFKYRLSVPVKGTLNPYYAFKAVLGEVVNYNKTAKQDQKIKSILTPTFCTGCGKIPLKVALLQMKKAFDVVHDGVSPNWAGALDLCHYLEKLEDLEK